MGMQFIVGLILLTGPNNMQEIWINPVEIVSMRTPRALEHFAKGTQCVIFTTDKKQLAIHQLCSEVRDRIAVLQHTR